MNEPRELRNITDADMFAEFCRRVMQDNAAGPELRYFCRPFHNEFERRLRVGQQTTDD